MSIEDCNELGSSHLSGPRHKSIGWVLLASASILWAVAGVPIFGVFILSYLLVWSLFSRSEGSWSPRWTAAAVAGGSIAFIVTLLGSIDRIMESEQLTDLDVVLADRWRLSNAPSIAPPVAHTDRTNLHYVWAPDTERALLRFAGSKRDTELIDLGHGLFRAELDPSGGSLTGSIEIETDGTIHRRELQLIRPTAHPRWISSRDGTAATVSTETNELLLVAGELERIPVEGRPTDCAFLDDGRVAVIHESGAVVLGTERVDLGAPLIHVATSSNAIAATRSEPRPAILILSHSLAIAAEIPLPYPPDWIALDGDTVLVSSAPTRSIHAIRNGRETARLFLGRPVVTMSLDPERRLLFAAVTDHRPDDDAGPNHHAEDQILQIDARTLAILRRIPTAPHASPYAIALSPDRITIAFAGSDEVIRYDRSFRELQRFPFDRPTGVAEIGGDPIISSAANARIGSHTLGEPDPLLLAGERAFYQATRAGLSCQTCHLHGGSDFSLHDIGHGDARPTLDPRGKARTAPYLRGASYPSIASLEAFTSYVLGGYEEPIPDRALALEAYVSSLARPPPRPRPDLGILRRGNDAFVKAGCNFCHRYPAFTDLAQVPEGFLFPERKDELHLLDTPSLIGVADSAPYLYDGRAKTLEEVLFDLNRSGRHGNARALSQEEREALLVFLRSL